MPVAMLTILMIRSPDRLNWKAARQGLADIILILFYKSLLSNLVIRGLKPSVFNGLRLAKVYKLGRRVYKLGRFRSLRCTFWGIKVYKVGGRADAIACKFKTLRILR